MVRPVVRRPVAKAKHRRLGNLPASEITQPAGTPPRQDLSDSPHITAIGWAANESLRTGLPAKVIQYD